MSNGLRWLFSREPWVYRRVDWMPPGQRCFKYDYVWYDGPHWMVNLYFVQFSWGADNVSKRRRNGTKTDRESATAPAESATAGAGHAAKPLK